MHALGGQGQPVGVRNCFSPPGGLRWSNSRHQLSKQLYVVQPSWWPVFKWNNFKSIILLIIIKILSSFTLSFYKPFLTTPVCIDFACVGLDDFSMCWLVSKCFAPPAPTPSSSLPLTLFHVCISLCDFSPSGHRELKVNQFGKNMPLPLLLLQPMGATVSIFTLSFFVGQTNKIRLQSPIN